jgi:putative membrane protein
LRSVIVGTGPERWMGNAVGRFKLVAQGKDEKMMWYSHGWGWAGWILMSVAMVAFWALVVTAVVLAVRYLAGARGTTANPPGSGSTRAEELLAERFARGEIDDNEYRQRLAALREHRTPGN